jgi:hypothetical protein
MELAQLEKLDSWIASLFRRSGYFSESSGLLIFLAFALAYASMSMPWAFLILV